MIWGAIAGAVFGVIFYVFRSGGLLILRDAETGIHAVLIQAVLHMVMPAAIGAGIGWAVS